MQNSLDGQQPKIYLPEATGNLHLVVYTHLCNRVVQKSVTELMVMEVCLKQHVYQSSLLRLEGQYLLTYLLHGAESFLRS
jgi:hypothetical protein